MKKSTREVFLDKDRETRYNILRREKYKCFLCGKGGVEVHEILPRSRFGRSQVDELFSMKNRVALCRAHHAEVHTRKYRILLIGQLYAKYRYDYSESPFRFYLEEVDG